MPSTVVPWLDGASPTRSWTWAAPPSKRRYQHAASCLPVTSQRGRPCWRRSRPAPLPYEGSQLAGRGGDVADRPDPAPAQRGADRRSVVQPVDAPTVVSQDRAQGLPGVGHVVQRAREKDHRVLLRARGGRMTVRDIDPWRRTGGIGELSQIAGGGVADRVWATGSGDTGRLSAPSRPRVAAETGTATRRPARTRTPPARVARWGTHHCLWPGRTSREMLRTGSCIPRNRHRYASTVRDPPARRAWSQGRAKRANGAGIGKERDPGDVRRGGGQHYDRERVVRGFVAPFVRRGGGESGLQAWRGTIRQSPA